MWNGSHGKKSEQVAAEIPEDVAHLLRSLDAVCAAHGLNPLWRRVGTSSCVAENVYVCMCGAVV